MSNRISGPFQSFDNWLLQGCCDDDELPEGMTEAEAVDNINQAAYEIEQDRRDRAERNN